VRRVDVSHHGVADGQCRADEGALWVRGGSSRAPRRQAAGAAAGAGAEAEAALLACCCCCFAGAARSWATRDGQAPLMGQPTHLPRPEGYQHADGGRKDAHDAGGQEAAQRDPVGQPAAVVICRLGLGRGPTWVVALPGRP
jgi:hypothetical protein